MKKVHYIALLVLVLVLMIYTSCYKNDLDLDKWREPLSSSWVLPLLNAHFTINDISLLGDFINTNADGSIDLVYREDSVVLQSAAEYFDIIPNQELSEESAAVGDDPFNKLYQLDVFEDIRIDHIQFHAGLLNFSFDASTPVGSIVVFTIYNANREGEPAIFEFERTAHSLSGAFNVDGYTIDIEDFNDKNEIGYEYYIKRSPGLDVGDTIHFDWNFTDIKVRKAIGYFGNRTFDFNDGEYELDIDLFSNIEGELILSNPQIEVTITNPIGVPFRLEPELKAISGQTVKNIQLPPLDLKGASSIDDPEVITFTFDKDNSDIIELFSTLPDVLQFSGQLISNPDMDDALLNFASRFNIIQVDMGVKIPLDFSAEGITIRQSFEDLDFNFDANTTIESMLFRFKNENSFPFDARLNLFFHDKEGARLDSLHLPVVQAADVQDNGRVISPNHYQYEVKLDSQSVQNIINTHAIQLSVFISTPDAKAIQLFDDYYFKSQVSAQADLIQGLDGQ